jgi:hypothetical protein
MNFFVKVRGDRRKITDVGDLAIMIRDFGHGHANIFRGDCLHTLCLLRLAQTGICATSSGLGH